jgi:hypothetical protein
VLPNLFVVDFTEGHLLTSSVRQGRTAPPVGLLRLKVHTVIAWSP